MQNTSYANCQWGNLFYVKPNSSYNECDNSLEINMEINSMLSLVLHMECHLLSGLIDTGM